MLLPKFILFPFIAVLCSCNRSPNYSSAINFPDILDNERTESHTRVKGTSIYYVPLISINEATKDLDTKTNQGSIGIRNLIDIDPDWLIMKDLPIGKNTLIHKKVLVNSCDAVYAECIIGDIYFLMMRIKDEDIKVSVFASVYKSNVNLIDLVRSCIGSIIYDKNHVLDPWESADFLFNYKEAGLNFFDQGDRLYLFSSFPCPDTERYNKGSLVKISQISLADFNAFHPSGIIGLQNSKLQFISDEQLITRKNIKISNLDAVEIIYKEFHNNGQFFDLIQEVYLKNSKNVFLIESVNYDEDEEVFYELCEEIYDIKFNS